MAISLSKIFYYLSKVEYLDVNNFERWSHKHLSLFEDLEVDYIFLTNLVQTIFNQFLIIYLIYLLIKYLLRKYMLVREKNIVLMMHERKNMAVNGLCFKW